MSQQSLPFDEPPTGQTVLPIYQNIIESCVDIILDRFKQQLPDLSNIHILLSSSGAVTQFRSVLLQKADAIGHSALLGPNIMSLENWAKQQSLLSLTTLSEHSRELLLVGALKEFPHIYKQSSPWTLAESLMELFDELTLANIELPKNLEDFQQKISDAYGATEDVKATLGKEALLVHTLWYAMQQQLSDLGSVDRTTANLLHLGNSTEQLPDNQHVFFCGIDNPAPSETDWRKQLLKRQQLNLIVQNYSEFNSKKSDDPYHRFLDFAYDIKSINFYQRVELCKEQLPESPVQSRIRIFASESAEDEALAIDIQVRRWLLQGKTRIGIVTENRKLARRVRALLERANITVNDDAGWALSTTSAATVLERWLETVEQDFHYLPLLDFLKSPFVLANDDEFLKTVYQFEQHIVVDENTPNDISRYLRHIELRKTKLQEDNIKVDYDALVELLTAVNTAARPLLALQKSNEEHNSGKYIDALLDSLHLLKVVDAFSEDAAGLQILSEINELKLAAKQIPTIMDWFTFRSWLGRTFERFNFKPEPQPSPVKLTTLSNSEYFKFDACIIAGSEQQFLPHTSKVSPFFNDAVRSALNVTTQADRQAVNYFLFRRLLCSVKHNSSTTGEILITRRSMDNGEEIIASPWLAALQSFHMQCYGSDLCDDEIPELLASAQYQVILDEAALPTEISENPKTKIPQTLLPETLSASAYQQLVDCPYQFFAARCLGLAPPDVVKEALQKLDYGNLVHRCLEAFHSNVKGLPGPYQGQIYLKDREKAIGLLNEISLAVFSEDIEDNFLHRGWLRRWQQIIPLYINWQMEQQEISTPIANEVDIKKTPLSERTSIKGRIDRIDKKKHGLVILDYKTGRTHKKEEMISGEATQLPFYLMLLLTENNPKFTRHLEQADDYVTAFYVDLYNNKKVSSKAIIENQELLKTVDQNRHRLLAVMDQLHQGHEAPAWGSVDVCKHCKMDVLCRKQAWSND